MSEKKLLSIFVEWRDEKGDRCSVTYNSSELGEDRVKLRAQQRVEICRAAQLTLTAYRFEFDDGSVVRAV